MKRREFAMLSAAAAASAALPQARGQAPVTVPVIDDFQRPDSFYAGHGWHSLNPGYWEIKGAALRRRIHTRGDRGRKTGFPFHAYMETEYEFLPPYGMIWRRDWKLEKNFTISVEITVHQPPVPIKAIAASINH